MRIDSAERYSCCIVTIASAVLRETRSMPRGLIVTLCTGSHLDFQTTNVWLLVIRIDALLLWKSMLVRSAPITPALATQNRSIATTSCCNAPHKCGFVTRFARSRRDTGVPRA